MIDHAIFAFGAAKRYHLFDNFGNRICIRKNGAAAPKNTSSSLSNHARTIATLLDKVLAQPPLDPLDERLPLNKRALARRLVRWVKGGIAKGELVGLFRYQKKLG